jgi:hypothetical protein
MYWVVVGLLMVFGTVTGFSIGVPFLLLGFVLGVLSPWRRDVRVMAPAIAAVVGLVAGYVLVAPLGCTTTSTATTTRTGTGESFTTCSNLVGINYSGSGLYNPSLLPALLAGLATGVVAAGLTWWATARPRAATPRPGG